jgi:hypothetical protein
VSSPLFPKTPIVLKDDAGDDEDEDVDLSAGFDARPLVIEGRHKMHGTERYEDDDESEADDEDGVGYDHSDDDDDDDGVEKELNGEESGMEDGDEEENVSEEESPLYAGGPRKPETPTSMTRKQLRELQEELDRV